MLKMYIPIDEKFFLSLKRIDLTSYSLFFCQKLISAARDIEVKCEWMVVTIFENEQRKEMNILLSAIKFQNSTSSPILHQHNENSAKYNSKHHSISRKG